MHFFEYVLWSAKGVNRMNDLLVLLGFVAFWIVLQKYILPRLGVPT